MEAVLYTMDEANEALVGGGSSQDAPHRVQTSQQILEGMLVCRGLLDERTRHELRAGWNYWQLERSICRRLLSGLPVTWTEVVEAHTMKSFDYRTLNLLLFNLRREPPDERLLAFLQVDELLTDISDDLVDYEDDVLSNAFNIFRLAV